MGFAGTARRTSHREGDAEARRAMGYLTSVKSSDVVRQELNVRASGAECPEFTA